MGYGKGRGECDVDGDDSFFGGGCFEHLYASFCRFVGCICCILVFGFVLMIIGLIMLVSATSNDRQHRIDQYNTAVDTFLKAQQSNTDPFFTLNDMTLTLTPAGSAVLTRGTPTDIPAVDSPSGSEVIRNKDYTPVAFMGSIPSTTRSMALVLGGTTLSAMSITPTTTNVLSSTQLSNCPSSGSTSDRLTKCRNSCNNKQGVFDSNTYSCTVTRTLQRICVRVRPPTTTGGAWAIDSAGDSGCLWDDGRITDQEYFTSIGGPTAIPVVVRHYQDPFTVYLRITNGGGFGLTTVQKIVIGLVLLIIGAVWELVICGCVYFLLYPIYKRKMGGQSASSATVTTTVQQPPMMGVQTQPPMMQPQPVMMQQPMMQPMGMQPQYQQQPMGYQPQPMGYQQQPMGYQQQPMGYQQPPMYSQPTTYA